MKLSFNKGYWGIEQSYTVLYCHRSNNMELIFISSADKCLAAGSLVCWLQERTKYIYILSICKCCENLLVLWCPKRDVRNLLGCVKNIVWIMYAFQILNLSLQKHMLFVSFKIHCGGTQNPKIQTISLYKYLWIWHQIWHLLYQTEFVKSIMYNESRPIQYYISFCN